MKLFKSYGLLAIITISAVSAAVVSEAAAAAAQNTIALAKAKLRAGEEAQLKVREEAGSELSIYDMYMMFERLYEHGYLAIVQFEVELTRRNNGQESLHSFICQDTAYQYEEKRLRYYPHQKACWFVDLRSGKWHTNTGSNLSFSIKGGVPEMPSLMSPYNGRLRVDEPLLVELSYHEWDNHDIGWAVDVEIPLDKMRRTAKFDIDLFFNLHYRNDISEGKEVARVDVPF